MRILVLEELECISGGSDGGTTNNCGGVNTGTTTGCSANNGSGNGGSSTVNKSPSQVVNRALKEDYMPRAPVTTTTVCVNSGLSIGLGSIGTSTCRATPSR